tara:strand:- start:2187 stop:2609 length:423 start_codon:yes stop_codon:yes gene_type:complete
MLSWFSPQRTDYKINYEDVQKCRGSYLIINTLPIEEQNCLIVGTIPATQEAKRVNELLSKNTSTTIIIYGKNCNDETVSTKYNQLSKLGFTQVYVYQGGLFEWLLLQDIYGKDEFPTTTQELDILKYKPAKILSYDLATM